MKNTYTAHTMTVYFNEDAIYNFIDENMETLLGSMTEGNFRDFGKNITVQCTYNSMLDTEEELNGEPKVALYELYTTLMTVKFQIDEDGDANINDLRINAGLYLNSIDDMVSNEEI